MPSVLAAVMAYLLVRAAWHVSGLVFRAPQARSARCFSQRPLVGRWSSSALKGLRALADHGPDSVLPPHRRLHSSPPPSQQYPALGAGGIPLLGLVSVGPDVDAFTGGVVTGLSAAFVVLALLGGLSIVRRILGS